MGEQKGTYITIALNDYQFYKEASEKCAPNPGIIVQGQQVVEKILKGILNVYGEDKHSQIFMTHNIKTLTNAVKEYFPDFDYSVIRKCEGYYFSIRYPGDSFFVPDESDYADVKDAVYSAIDLLKKVLEIKDKLLLCTVSLIV